MKKHKALNTFIKSEVKKNKFPKILYLEAMEPRFDY